MYYAINIALLRCSDTGYPLYDIGKLVEVASETPTRIYGGLRWSSTSSNLLSASITARNNDQGPKVEKHSFLLSYAKILDVYLHHLPRE